jgi:SAM-dependent methyltransferase
MIAPPRIFDRSLRRRRLDRAAATTSSADFLHCRAATDLVARLKMVRRVFPVALELGARHGTFRNVLAAAGLGNVGWLIETGPSTRMLGNRPGSRLAVDEERLPLADASLDLIVSALALHWTNDLVGTLIQIRRSLRTDGLFLAALLGGATLTELRQVLTEAELDLIGGANLRVSPFVDAPDAAALLQRAGFASPVADVDTVKVRYDHPLKLLADLRAMGETGAFADRPRALRRAVVARASEIYATRFSDADGKIVATFEILTLTGWAPAMPRLPAG